MVAAQKSTGLAVHARLKLEKFQLATAQIIVDCSFDGAASRSGQCNGLQAQLKKDIPDMQFVHCYAHVLDLVMTNATESSKVVKDFLELLQAPQPSSLNPISESRSGRR